MLLRYPYGCIRPPGWCLPGVLNQLCYHERFSRQRRWALNEGAEPLSFCSWPQVEGSTPVVGMGILGWMGIGAGAEGESGLFLLRFGILLFCRGTVVSVSVCFRFRCSGSGSSIFSSALPTLIGAPRGQRHLGLEATYEPHHLWEPLKFDWWLYCFDLSKQIAFIF